MGCIRALWSQPVTIEVRSMDGTAGETSVASDDSGRYLAGVVLPEGAYTLTARVTTRVFGIVESDPVTVTVDT